jgi:hypothetical protein
MWRWFKTVSSPFGDRVLNQGGVGGDVMPDARRFPLAITHASGGGLGNTKFISSHNMLTSWEIEPQARRPLPCAGLVGPAKTTWVYKPICYISTGRRTHSHVLLILQILSRSCIKELQIRSTSRKQVRQRSPGGLPLHHCGKCVHNHTIAKSMERQKRCRLKRRQCNDVWASSENTFRQQQQLMPSTVSKVP